MVKSGMYGNPFFSVQAGACTEIISFPYSRSGRDPTHPKIGLNHPQIAHVRKRVLFRTWGTRGWSLSRPMMGGLMNSPNRP